MVAGERRAMSKMKRNSVFDSKRAAVGTKPAPIARDYHALAQRQGADMSPIRRPDSLRVDKMPTENLANHQNLL